MKYDRKKHFTSDQLAILLDVPLRCVPGNLSDEDAPRVVGRTVIDGKRKRLYDRSEVVAWLERQAVDPEPKPDSKTKSAREPDRVREPYKGERVPPRAIRPLHAQGEYQPSPALSVNFARASEVYPHRLYTPAGIGNGLEFAPGFDRGR